MASFNNLPWSQFKPFTRVGKIRTYVQLPAFSYTPNYTGASELVTQFNFSASRNFYLRNRPAKPTGVNYLLCIKYRVGETVYRYKLWHVDGAPNLEEVPLYNSNLIRANFVLEVWSIDTTASQDEAINIITSVTEVVTDLEDLGDVALAVGEEFNSYNNIAPAAVALPANITGGSGYYRYTSADIVGVGTATQWTNSGSLQTANDDFLPVGGAPNIVAGPNGYNALENPNMLAEISGNNFWMCFAVIKLTSWAADRTLFSMYKNGVANSQVAVLCSQASDGSPYLRLEGTDAALATLYSAPNGELPLNTWGVIAFKVQDAVGVSGFSVSNAPLNNLAAAQTYPVTFDRLAMLPVGGADIAELILYNGSDPFEQVAGQVWQYLYQRFPEMGFEFPISFEQVDNGAAWLDNEE